MKQEVTVKNGMLVRMRRKDGEVVEKSIPDVGHEMKRGAVIIDQDGNVILAKLMRIRRVLNGTPAEAMIIDPGPNHQVGFIPDMPGHLAMVYKA